MENRELNLVLIVIGVLVLMGFIFSPMMGFGKYRYGYGMMSGYYFGGTWIFMTIICILVIIALVLFILWIVKQLQINGHEHKITRRSK